MPRWDLFCRVVDNFGDIGTCWRLAQQVAEDPQQTIRLWVDNLSSFASLCPSIQPDVTTQHVGLIEVRLWPPDFPEVEVADVVIEAFACDIPASYLAAMSRRTVAPIWINLEYLSAEAWVEDCHRLTSPHPRFPLLKHFFFPGFTLRTGGLLCEPDLLATRAAFPQAAVTEFWQTLRIPPRTADELRISLFCYENSVLPEMLRVWAAGPGPVCILATPGAAAEQIACWFGKELLPGTTFHRDSLTVHALPFLPQSAYDRLLWACDLNFVRGEDSFVRAQWAQRPFVWQIYPQAEKAQHVKLAAFLTRYLNDFDAAAPAAASVRRFWHAWNEMAPLAAAARQIGDPDSYDPATNDLSVAWRDFVASRQALEQHGKVWASHLDRVGNLADNLSRLVREISSV